MQTCTESVLPRHYPLSQVNVRVLPSSLVFMVTGRASMRVNPYEGERVHKHQTKQTNVYVYFSLTSEICPSELARCAVDVPLHMQHFFSVHPNVRTTERRLIICKNQLIICN